ncbi:MAG: LytTR family DNA-binding domain-containing protein, partial [Mediterranea sp.]|nr:LytTR family DNA-binding domain-containing protein [Mediterranea sp.]
RILLKNLCSMLPQESFLRIHRSFIVSKSKVKCFNKQEITLCNGKVLPVGRQYVGQLSTLNIS